MARDRIVLVFDEAYVAHASVVYGVVRLLTQQLAGAFSCEVFCDGRYSGPRFKGRTRAKVWPVAEGLARTARQLAQAVDQRLESLHLAESPRRWASNLAEGEDVLLRRLYKADDVQAVIIFTADPERALRVVKLTHIYASSETPHLLVVTPNDRLPAAIAADLDWLGARVLRDGNLIISRNRRPIGRDGAAEPESRSISETFSFVAAADYPGQLGDPCEPIDWSARIGDGLPHRKRVRDVVLFVRPDWMNCGSGTTFETLAHWFKGRNALLIDVGIWPYREDFKPEGRKAQVAEEQVRIGAALYLTARRSNSLPNAMRQINLLLRWFPRSVARQKFLQHGFAAKPRLFRQAIRHAKITQIYINHYFTYGYVREFIGKHPFFLDTHDIQTVNFIHSNQQNAITRRADRFDESLRDEMEIAGKAQRLSFVSTEELELAARHIDRERLDYVLPLPNVIPCVRKPPADQAQLLIVSSQNPSNVQNMNWFLTHVWAEVLRLCGPQLPPLLRICGGIAAAMRDVDIPGVAFVGIVDDLRSYYEQSDLVLLPVITGGGVAIKTLEAVLHERAVLATRHALRGLPEDVVRTIGHEDDPLRFASTLLSIAASPDRIGAQLKRSQQAATALRRHSFQETLGRAMDAVRFNEGLGRSSEAASTRDVIIPPKQRRDDNWTSRAGSASGNDRLAGVSLFQFRSRPSAR